MVRQGILVCWAGGSRFLLLPPSGLSQVRLAQPPISRRKFGSELAPALGVPLRASEVALSLYSRVEERLLRVRAFLFLRDISHIGRIRVAILLAYAAGWGGCWFGRARGVVIADKTALRNRSSHIIATRTYVSRARNMVLSKRYT